VGSLTILTLAVTLAACGASSGYQGPQGPRTPAAESPGPALAVERFLRAANANDLETMVQLFGTHDRNVEEMYGKTRAEQRMYVLASLVRHDDWSIVGQQTVPGRMMDATDLLVQLTRNEESVTVPFLVVRTNEGGWIIERIDVGPLTQLPAA
jgi:hypothetical protein